MVFLTENNKKPQKITNNKQVFLSFSLQFNFLAQVEGSLRAQNSYGNKKSVLVGLLNEM